MKSWKFFSVTTLMLGMSAIAAAQRGMPRGGNYDPATEVTLTGTIDEVKQVPAAGRGSGGLHLIVTTETGPVDVHVGPAAFVSSKNVTFANGDRLTVTGSKVTMGGEAALIAREIKKGDQVLVLRDARGIPLWSGRGRPR